jgi:hypothetical protein
MTGIVSSGTGTTERAAGEWLQIRNRFRRDSRLMFTRRVALSAQLVMPHSKSLPIPCHQRPAKKDV